MTSKYSLSQHSITEQPRMGRPNELKFPVEGNKYFLAMANYYKHLRSLRTIPCDESAKGLWEDGQVLEDGKDYEVKEVPCPYFDHIDDPVEYTTTAFPLVAGEDELWLELVQKVFSHVEGHDAEMNYDAAIAELKKYYKPLIKK